MTRTPIHAAARWYAEFWGWLVFVLSPTKSPVKLCKNCPPHGTDGHDGDLCTCLTCHGFYAATRDPDRIDEMVRRHPGGILAVRTGARERGSGIAVLDVDNHDSLLTLEQALGGLPDTRTAITGRGGLHMVFAHPGGRIRSGSNMIAADLPGLDVKADDAYIVVAPTVHPVTRDEYFWARTDGGRVAPLLPWPSVLTQLMDATPPPRPPVHLPNLERASAYAEAALRNEIDNILRATPGKRHDTIRAAAFSLGQLVGAGQLEHETTRSALLNAVDLIGCGDRKAEDTVLSGLRKGAQHPRGATA